MSIKIGNTTFTDKDTPGEVFLYAIEMVEAFMRQGAYNLAQTYINDVINAMNMLDHDACMRYPKED